MGQSGVILLDTHVLIWLISDFERLSAPAKREIRKARKMGEGLAISSISMLEVASLSRKNRIELGMSLEGFLQSLEESFTVLPITGRACARTVEFPADYPRDPADRIIGATALVDGLTLITADRNILASQAVRTVW
jgi:PIN domain nuclease of toxin-antitoxin system